MTRLVRAVATAAIAATSGWTGCGGAPAVVPPAPQPAPDSIAEPARSETRRSYAALDTAATRLTILVATTRRAVASPGPAERFSGDDADSLQYAAVGVNVPPYRARGVGTLTRQSSISAAFGSAPVPDRDFFVASVIPADSTRFVQRLDAELSATRSRDVLVFVHGFNISFEEAALRAAQVTADVGFDGAVVLFTWPSAASVTSYVRDLQSARNSGYYLLQLMRGAVRDARPDRIHLLGHSMGSEVISKALLLAQPADTTWRLTQAVLAAPDVDARVFRRETLPVLRGRAERVTLYASSDDDALRASRVMNGVWRLGLGGDSLTVAEGMDTIDASRVRADALGHTLFGNASFLADLALLLGEGRSPEERRLLAAQQGSLTYWRFRGDAR